MKYDRNRYYLASLAFLSIAIAFGGYVLDRSGLIYSNLVESNINLNILVTLATTAISIVVGIMSLKLHHEFIKKRKEEKIFIAYSRKDSKKAKEIYDFLKKNNLNPWIDSEDIYPGDNWKKLIENTIEESAIVLILLSENSLSNTTGYIAKEIEKSLKTAQIDNDMTSTVIPVRLSNVELPNKLADIQAIDYFGDNAKVELERLLIGLRRLAEFKT